MMDPVDTFRYFVVGPSKEIAGLSFRQYFCNQATSRRVDNLPPVYIGTCMTSIHE